jgi:hypothetical protein
MGMDDLTAAASEARERAQQARQGLAAGRAGCEGKTERLTTLREQLAADREALAVAMEELAQASGEAASRLATAVNGAAAAVGTVTDPAGNLALFGGGVLESATRDFDEAATTLGKLAAALTEVLDSIEELQDKTLQSLGGDAVEQLQRESDRAESHLAHQRRTRLERLTPALEELMDDALELLETRLPQELGQVVDLWGLRLEHTLEQADGAFDALLRHAGEVAAHCAYQLEPRLAAARDSAAAEAGRVAVELQELASSLVLRRGEVETALDFVAERLVAGQAELRAASGRFEAVSERWDAAVGFGL